MSFFDPSGNAYQGIRSQINYNEYEHTYGGLRSVNPSGLLVEYQYPTGTVSVCLVTTVAYGYSVSTAQGVTLDWNGNIGHMHSTGVGAGFPSVGVALAITFTDAENIYLQRGLAAQVGGSVNVMGLSIGYDHSFFTNSETGALYQGHTYVIGLDASYPLEFHGGVSNTSVYGINLFGLY